VSHSDIKVFTLNTNLKTKQKNKEVTFEMIRAPILEGVLREPDGNVGDVCECLEGDDDAANAEVVEDKFVLV
jgi:hypothetical protein